MLLHEIEAIDFISKSNATFKTLEKDWTNLIKKFRPYLLGTIAGKFRVAAVDGSLEGNAQNKLVVVYDTNENKYAVFLQLTKFSNSAYQESIIAANREYRGIDLPVQLYAFLIEEDGMIIVSDEVQTMGARSVWEKLATIPNIGVYGYNDKTKKVFQVDMDDLFNEDVYDEGLNQEIENLENEEYELQDVRDSRYFQIKRELEKLYKARIETNHHIRLFAARTK